MDEGQLRAWDREIVAWRKLLAGRPVPPALEEELEAAAAELQTVRAQAGQPLSGERVRRHLSRLHDLWVLLYAGDESRTTPA
jgi:hypothetical protein